MRKTIPDKLDLLIDWIGQSDDLDVAGWMHHILRNEWQYFPIELRRMTAEEVVLTVYRHSNDPEVKGRVWTALGIRAAQAAWQTEDMEYLASLLACIGQVNAHPALDTLARLGNRGTLKKRFLSSGVSLHRFVLSAMAGISNNARVLPIFSRDMEEPEFTGICFRGLWLSDLSLGVNHAPLLVKIGKQDSRLPTQWLLKELMGNLSLDQVWQLILQVTKSDILADDEKTCFIDFVRNESLGVQVDRDSRDLVVNRLESSKPELLRIAISRIDYQVLFWLHDGWLGQLFAQGAGHTKSREDFDAMLSVTPFRTYRLDSIPAPSLN